MRKIRRSYLLLLAIVVIATGVYFSAAFFFPLQTSALKTHLELRWHGVSGAQLGVFNAYERSFCDVKAPERCACVVLIHGLSDTADTWKSLLLAPRETWKQPVHWIAVNLQGAGDSPAAPNPSDYRVRVQAQLLREALAPLCASWTVVGNSLGGWVAAWLALEWPSGVNKLLLVDSAGLRVEPKEVALLLTEPTVESMKEFQLRAFYKPRPISERVWPLVVERMKGNHSRDIARAQVPEDFLDDKIVALRKPTIVFWGAADRVILPQVGRQLAQLIPGAIFREAPRCGHLPQKECVAPLMQTLNDLLEMGAM